MHLKGHCTTLTMEPIAPHGSCLPVFLHQPVLRGQSSGPTYQLWTPALACASQIINEQWKITKRGIEWVSLSVKRDRRAKLKLHPSASTGMVLQQEHWPLHAEEMTPTLPHRPEWTDPTGIHVGELTQPLRLRWVAPGAWTEQFGYYPGPQLGLGLTHSNIYTS